jgi:hypothetical protein
VSHGHGLSPSESCRELGTREPRIPVRAGANMGISDCRVAGFDPHAGRIRIRRLPESALAVDGDRRRCWTRLARPSRVRSSRFRLLPTSRPLPPRPHRPSRPRVLQQPRIARRGPRAGKGRGLRCPRSSPTWPYGSTTATSARTDSTRFQDRIQLLGGERQERIRVDDNSFSGNQFAHPYHGVCISTPAVPTGGLLDFGPPRLHREHLLGVHVRDPPPSHND